MYWCDVLDTVNEVSRKAQAVQAFRYWSKDLSLKPAFHRALVKIVESELYEDAYETAHDALEFIEKDYGLLCDKNGEVRKDYSERLSRYYNLLFAYEMRLRQLCKEYAS